MRDINRVMERETAKGSSPLRLDHIKFGDYSYQEITSKEKLLEELSYLLRIGDFSQYAGKTILNNVYMDLRGKKPVFKRTRMAMERNNIFATIKRYAKKLKLQYNVDVYLETVRCYFDIPKENLEKYRYISRKRNICFSNVRQAHHGIVYALSGGEKGSCFARDTDRGLYRERVWNGKSGESGECFVSGVVT